MKKCLIVGANSDIGYELTKILASKKNKLILISRNISRLELKKKNLREKYNITCKTLYFDLEDLKSFDNILEEIDSDLNIIIFVSGYYEKPEKNLEKINIINFEGPSLFIDKILNKKNFKNIEQIICLSSVAADRNKNINQYALSKKKLSTYLFEQSQINKKIIIKNIKPGYVKTKMTKNFYLNKYLTSNPKYIAKKIYANINSEKHTIYIPFYWKLLVKIYNSIPKFFIR